MTEVNNFIGLVVNSLPVKILTGQTKSEIVNVMGSTLKTLILPAVFTGTEISFEISIDGITFYPYYNIDNNLVKFSCTQGRAYGFAAIDFYSIQYLKLVSNATEGAERNLTLITRGI